VYTAATGFGATRVVEIYITTLPLILLGTVQCGRAGHQRQDHQYEREFLHAPMVTNDIRYPVHPRGLKASILPKDMLELPLLL